MRAEIDRTLGERAARDLATRSLPGTVVYLVLGAVLMIATHPLRLPPWSFLTFGLGTLLGCILRLESVRELARGRHLVYQVSTLGIAVLWGLHGAVVLSHGIDPIALLTLLCLAGCSAGAITAMAPGRAWQSMLYQGLLLGPTLLMLAVAAPGNRVAGAALVMIAIYAAYQLVQARTTCRQYRKHLEIARELELTNEEIDAASRAKSHFLANMSHELRTPLTAIRGFADLLSDGHGEEATQHASIILRNSDHLLAIINDILDLSRVEAGKLKVEPVLTPAGQVVCDVEALLRLRAENKGITLSVGTRGPIPSRIPTDPLRVRQILLNLVGNAIRHTERGGVGVTVELLPGNKLAFVVNDTGDGMTPEQLSRLFQPFSQVDHRAARRQDGTGLGLVISRELARLLGGEITMTSIPGRGTSATLIIPTGSLEGVPMWKNLRGTASDGATTALAFKRVMSGHVLVVEDEIDAERLVRAHLEHAGATVSVVANGQEALERIASARPPYDLVLMDMVLPGLDGYGVTRELRRRGYQGAVVALTAAAMAGDRERCLAAGCDDYLPKPLDRTQFLEVVSQYLTRRRQRPTLAA